MRFYHLDIIDKNGKPEPEIVESLFESGLLQNSIENHVNSLTIFVYGSEALASSLHDSVMGANIALYKKGFALAIDQANGLLFADVNAVEQVRIKYPAIKILKQHGYSLNLDDLCDMLVMSGFKIANVKIHIDQGELEIYEVLRKRWWHRPGTRWWQAEIKPA